MGVSGGSRGRRLLLAGLLSAQAPGWGCAPERSVAVDLLPAFADAELRSDTLDLPFLASDPLFERRGWTALEGSGERRGAWTLGGRSRLRLPFHSAGDKELYVRVRSHESLGPSLPLALTLNDAPLTEVTFTPREQEFRIVIPASVQVRGDNVLGLQAPRQRQPGPGEADRRRLVAAFSALVVRPLGSTRRAAVPGLDGGRIVLPPSSSVGYYLRLPEAARLQAGIEGSASGSPRLLGSLEDDSARRPLLERPAPAGKPTSVEAGLEEHAGAIVRLELANPASDGLLWLSRPRLTVPSKAVRGGKGAAAAKRPNLVIYLADTLRADHLGAYGQPAPTSPRFDAFAREAILFEDAWAQASWTRPAVASIFTGLHVGTHGVDREDRVLSGRPATLAQLLRAAGYRTGAFVANHLLGGRFGFSRGFDTWNGGDDALYGAPAAGLVQMALKFVESGAGPFFLYVHAMEPHSPYTPAEEDLRPFASEGYRGDRDTRALLRLGQLGQLAPEGLRFLKSRYLGEVRQNDRAFGALLDALRSRRLLDQSVVLFTSDHGEEFLEHGGTEHAKTLYQELVRVPLAVRLPGAVRGGTREWDPVEQIDLLPTILSLAGARPPVDLPGRDLSSRWLSGAGEAAAPLLFSEERFAVVDKFSVRAGTVKLILNNDGPELWRAGSHLELYDLERDPGEKSNLVASRPIAVAFLRQRLDLFRKAQDAARALAGGAEAIALSPEEKEQLRALGYVR